MKSIIIPQADIPAILDGSKTQLRIRFKKQPTEGFHPEPVGFYTPTLIDRRDGETFPGKEVFGAADENEGYIFPYGKPGDRILIKAEFHWRIELEITKVSAEQYNFVWFWVVDFKRVES